MTKTFRDLGVATDLTDALADQHITVPFPIQELTLPLALGGNDLIAQARTGTGKTLAFGLPLLQRLDPARPVTQALVVVPTRELCLQVHGDLTIGEVRGVTSVSVYGGVDYGPQTEALRSGAHVVVGTPGRLLDHLGRGNLDLSAVSVLVLDEADEMLDMGFLPDVERLIEACPTPRHSMLFSATMPTAIVRLARRYLTHPTFVRADTEEHETAPTVDQHFFTVHRMDKPRVLARLLQTPDRGGCYVFVRTKNMADRLVTDLEELGVAAIAIHGDLRQQTRERNLDRFRNGRADVLVATEVAARGLDVTGVTHVVNYDCPDDEKMYLHRIGRTARAGQAGVAITFAEFNEVDRLNVIRKAVGAHDTEVVQVFSTSELLTERFDLPTARPWDHLARAGNGAPRPRAADGRRGRSDGRPKSRRGSEGAGTHRDATRRGEGARAPRERDTDRQAEPAGDRRRARRRTAGADAAPERTRTRRRDDTERERAAEPPREGRPAAGGDARTSGRGTTRRSDRARQTSDRTGRRTDDGTGERADAGARRTPHGARRRSGAGEPERRGSGRDDRRQPADDEGRQSRPRRQPARSEHEAAEATTPERSRHARGQGQPQLARRVKVEHLP